ncbi:alpha/beta fold hydrolase [Colwellia sp. E2M01]|uniref:alpha/beta fold hydrolase n=1 Tax=Colwellia sp. E2M01 TaxID=2841561 RepID=UPI001C092A03|nr:alpha/beta fold hydrolase [Colwellia sp. E2M01]MBU2869348.1 alpha/beta hydrolase [Colwellia sp. E2M01]
MVSNTDVNSEQLNNTQIEEISYQLDDIKLTALACGSENHQPILCLHGYLDNAASFLPLMHEVTQASMHETIPKNNLLTNRRIIALEWPGHGHSSHRSNGAHYHFVDYVSDLLALFTLNNWQAIDIVAHSMGAMIASAFAAAFPEKVKSLTLIDSFGFVCAPVEQTTKQLREGLLSRYQSPVNKRVKPTRQFTEAIAIKARMQVSDLPAKYARLIVQRSLVLVEENGIKSLYRWRSDPRLRTISPYRLSLAQGQQLFSDIKCPIQLIYGDHGMKMVAQGLDNFSTTQKKVTTIKLAGGHHVHMEQAKALATMLNSFVNRISRHV